MDSTPNSSRLIIISDLHIGGDSEMEDFECENELISFLEHLEKEKLPLELIILGDFFDLWNYKKDNDNKVGEAIKRWHKLFEAVRKLGQKIKITLIPGNHDHELVYNKKYQNELEKYNITLDINQYFKREFNYNGKKFRIIGEHGNQVEPGTAFPDFNMPTDSSLSYHIYNLFVHKFLKIGNEKKRPSWLKGLENVDVELIPYWLISKYFYHEIGPILRMIIVPMLILFSIAIPYFIFDLITDYYQPKFLMPLLSFMDTNLFMKAIIFIIYFDMVIVLLLFILSFLRKDFYKRLKSYGVVSLSEIIISKHNAYLEKAVKVTSGDNPYKQKADMYVTGHTHSAELKKDEKNSFIFADTGSWRQLIHRMKAYFSFPPVFYPYFELTYLSLSTDSKDLKIELRSWPKEFTPNLTILEKIAIKRAKTAPKPVLHDKLIKEIVVS
jgi:UDP-2,3-diacylglucosamine pyrophosphatase LpxH